MKANIKLSLSLLTPMKLLALFRVVIAKLTGNAIFPTPAVTLAAMTTQADTLEDAIEEATNGSRQSKLNRNKVVADSEAMLNKQAAYVRSVCNGDAVLLGSSGFELSKPREPIVMVDAPKGEVATAAKASGEIEFRFRKVHGAHYYRMYKSEVDPTTGNAVWVLLGTTTRVRNVLSGFASYKAFWFRVSAVGVNGEGLPSDAALGRAA